MGLLIAWALGRAVDRDLGVQKLGWAQALAVLHCLTLRKSLNFVVLSKYLLLLLLLFLLSTFCKPQAK